MAVEIVTTSLEAVKQSMSSCHERSTKARHAAQLILDKQKLKEPEILACFEKFSSELVNYFQSEIKSSTARLRSLSSKKERLWSLFHRIRMKDCLTLMWETLATKLNVSDNDPLLKQSLFEKVYEKCLYTYFAKYRCAHTDVKEDNVELTTHEANVVRYVGGYVARTLLKRHEKKDGDVESQYIQCLGDMAVEFEEGEGDDVLAYTRKWLEQTNRGGLFPINDTSFSLFAHIETCVRSLLPTYLRTTCTNSDKDKFQENVLKKILENEELQFYWALLSLDISNLEDSEQLLSEIVQLWITIRGFSIVATWMEVYKTDQKRNTQKSTGLRKSVSGTSSSSS